MRAMRLPERAHEFRMLEGTELVFDMAPTAALVNPVFLLGNWPADGVRISWGSREVEAGDLVIQSEEDNPGGGAGRDPVLLLAHAH